MQVGAVLILDAGSLALVNGGIDVERMRGFVAASLAPHVGFRRRWLDSALGATELAEEVELSLAYHVAHVALPRPADERALRRLASRFFSQRLDPEQPRFELCVVEGLDEGRFALLVKQDAELALDPEAGDLVAALCAPIMQREAARETPRPMRANRARASGVPRLLAHAVETRVRSALAAVDRALGGSARAPLRGGSGRELRLDWLELELASARRVAECAQASLDDVWLACASFALRRSLERRGVSAPRAAALTPARIELPLRAEHPREQLEQLATRHARVEPPGLFEPLARLAADAFAARDSRGAELFFARSLDCAHPLWLLDAPLRAALAVPPLGFGPSLAASVSLERERALVSFVADAAIVPDLSLFADAFASAFHQLDEAPPAHSRRRRAPRRAADAARA